MLTAYLKRQWKLLLLLAGAVAVFAAVFALYSLPVEAVAYAGLLCLMLGLVLFALGYSAFLRRHRELEGLLRKVHESVLPLPPPRGVLEADYQALLRAVCADRVRLAAENRDRLDTFYIEDLPFHIAGTIMDFPRYNSSILISGQTAQLFLVVADETVVSAISDRDASRVHREFRVQVDLDGTEEEKLAFVDPLLAADANDVYSVISHQDNAVDLYTMYGGFLFLGVFLGLLFLLSTVLIIYYKQISEGYEDQRRYQIMQQVGMSPREVRSSIRSQVLLVFFLPLVTAGIHVAAAFPMLCKLLELFNLFDVRLFALCAAGTLLVFCAIYALVYGLTTRTYSRIVGGQ